MPLQKIGLARMLAQDDELHLGIHADTMGVGKTQQPAALIVALIEALIETERFADIAHRGRSCPSPVVEKMSDDLRVGVKHPTPVTFDKLQTSWGPPRNFNDLPPAKQSIVFIDFYDLGRLHSKYKDPAAVWIPGRRSTASQQRRDDVDGPMLDCSPRTLTLAFSGSPLVSSLADLGGYLAFAPLRSQ
ncbi:hypothetical protein LTR97_007732 [Elasticomyces elasticus]|uniref:Uncharacterized protein n=1 Tax=Elasticomyces elasticus TaxID=574655 RepID=A0AAN7W8G1_9PEZI|nr:hypothetical protein LTR97_007732 [Elasticomyces elasticus]